MIDGGRRRIMGMTERQRTFLEQFLELYREVRAPVHYSAVAEKLKVSNISAYDMLRILKRKGMVASEYLLPKKRSGPGRSTVVFYPTQKARSLLSLPFGEDGERGEWEDLKKRTLQGLRRRKGDYDQMLEELLSRIPDRKSPMLRSAEMVTAMVLQMCQLGGEARSRVLEEVRGLLAAGESGLSALAGLPLGLMFADGADKGFASKLLSFVEGYQADLSRLSAESKKALSEFFLELVKTVEGEKA
jgi:energy-coupling factor transport system substrate-specific component